MLLLRLNDSQHRTQSSGTHHAGAGLWAGARPLSLAGTPQALGLAPCTPLLIWASTSAPRKAMPLEDSGKVAGGRDGAAAVRQR